MIITNYPDRHLMKEIRLKITDLFEVDAETRDHPKESGAITEYVLKHYAFLPLPVAVTPAWARHFRSCKKRWCITRQHNRRPFC